MASFVTHSPEQAGPTPKVHKNGSKPTRLIHQKTHIFQTVNHAKVIWDPAIKPRGIFGGHLNIRSLLPKHDEIQALLVDSNLDYLCLSESWLHSKALTTLIDIPGYTCFRKDRETGRGGGVVIYIRDSFKTASIELDYNDIPIECIGVTVHLSPEMRFRIIVLYNHPTHTNSFYNALEKLLKIVSHKTEVIIFGDFNVNWANKKSRSKLKSTMSKFDFSQVIEGPTRITKSTQSQIDLLFTNRVERICKTYNLITGLSDHNMILAARKLTKKRFVNNSQLPVPDKLEVPKNDLQKLEHELRGVSWNNVLQSADPNRCCHELMNIIDKIMSKFLKTKKKTNRKNSLPWIDSSIRQLMKKRDLALKESLKSHTGTAVALYKGLRNQVTKELRKAKSAYYINVITEAKGNSSLIWKQINSLIKPQITKNTVKELKINNQTISESRQIAQALNDYFVESVEEMARSFKSNGCVTTSTAEKIGHSFELHEVSQNQVIEIINNLKTTHSKDLSNLDVAFAKKHMITLAKPLTHLINTSMVSGKFPEEWKQARVIPIFKSGAVDLVSNYRPISILPVLSKILEKIVAKQLTAYLESNSYIHPLQFGFRTKFSTESANCYLLEKIKSYLDKGSLVGAVFLDLKRAFDTVNHSILISKLANYNFSQNTLAWFTSYLSNRNQCVMINNTKSSFSQIKTGVPQGSVLGPILFSLYINDLPKSCQGADFQMYADDAVIYAHGTTATAVSKKLTEYLEAVANWLDNSCLTLNVDKTVSMCFSSGRRPTPTTLNISINNQSITQVSEVNYLGLILDYHLKFDKHVKKISKIVKLNLYTFRLIRECLTFEAAKIFLHSMILSHFNYCITAWSQASPSVVKPLKGLYNRAIKILGKRPIRSHHCNVLRDLKMLSFENYITLSNSNLTHKCLHDQAPQALCDLVLPMHALGRCTRSATAGNCQVPKRKSPLGQSSFLVKGANTWNSLPTELKQVHNHKQFKAKLKEFLKDNQICSHR